MQLCKRNKADEVIEIIIGYYGVVIANSNQSHRFDFTKKYLFETSVIVVAEVTAVLDLTQ
jgi:phosphate transport system substrate-binding protein